MLTVTLFTRDGCHLCEQAKADLAALQEIIPHRLIEIDIEEDDALHRKYATMIPVVQVGPYNLEAPFDRQKLQMTLGAANDRKMQLEAIDSEEYRKRVERGKTVTGADRFTYWFSKHYLFVINLAVLFYVGLPFLAPVFMNAGYETPANVIYKVYSGLCHQLSYRSWFLFGEQPIYPRAAAEIDGYATFNEATGLDEDGLMAARWFTGNEQVGYKIAFCQRDVAIYGAMVLFGVIFSLTGRRLKPLPIWLWLLLGIFPIAIDGISQIISQWLANPFFQFLEPVFGWISYRESTPLLRTLTGGLFGFMTAWFGYPLIEEAMEDTRRIMKTKIAMAEGNQD